MPVNPIGRLATDIVNTEFDYITGGEATTLLTNTSGWLGSNVGQLNIKINTRDMIESRIVHRSQLSQFLSNFEDETLNL